MLKVNKFLDEIRPLALVKEVNISQLVIRWTLQSPGITVALVGARNEEQVKQNAGAARFQLSAEEMDHINLALEQVELDLT